MNGVALAVLAALVMAGAQPAFAQNYPVRPVRLVVPSSPGGTSDILARILAHKLVERLGQQVVVDNRAGAGGTIAYDQVAKSAPDGYTLLIAPASITINTSMYSKLPYNAMRDFAPISLLAAATNVLCVHPSVPAASVKALIALARSKPGILVAGSAGIGTSPHLSLELFKSMAGVDMVIVHYKGSGQGMIALLSGENALAMPTLPTVSPHLKAGKIRPVGVSAAKRSPMLPEVPTIAEAGVPGYEATNWFSLLAPAGTPQPIIDRVQQEIIRALRAADVRERLAAEGADLIGSTSDELADYMKSETEKWARVIKSAGIKTE
jgi:tripartite-type tricarboxylate transporter receptor subunit TctC